MVLTEVKQKIQLVEGQFTPSQANDIVKALLDEKINYHKLQRLSMIVGDEMADVESSDIRIAELIREKKIARDFINMARKEGKNVRINGILNISFED